MCVIIVRVYVSSGIMEQNINEDVLLYYYYVIVTIMTSKKIQKISCMLDGGHCVVAQDKKPE